MWKVFWIVGLGVGLVGGGMLWVGSTANFLFRHPKDPNARVVIDHQTGAAVLVGFNKPDPRSAPRAQAPEREFDFGTMAPLSMGKHDFVIRNAGFGPLTLTVGPTTCKCTMAGLEKNKLGPGEETKVTLEWNSGRHYLYEHSGTIYTNDPEQKSIELHIRGKVITTLGTDLAEIVVPAVNPDTPATTDLLVYSQVWDEFEIASVQCTLPGVTWEISPYDANSAKDLAAKTVQRVRFSIPGDLPDGPFLGTVQLSVTRPGEPIEHSLVLALQGTVLRRIDLFGGKVDAHGHIDLGSIHQGRGQKMRLLVKVRDRDSQIDLSKVTTFPAFLQAKLTPHVESNGRGLYHLDLELPATAPLCQYRGNPRAEVQIETGHPRIGSVKLGVTFAVLPALD